MQIAREARVIYDGLRLHAGPQPEIGREMVGVSPIEPPTTSMPKDSSHLQGVFEYVLRLRKTASSRIS
jgi:hypothetical protein